MGGAGAPTYVHGPGIDEPLGFGGSWYFIVDGLGSIRQIVDRNGNSLNQYRYTAFGKMKQVQGGSGNTYMFTGREWDADAGLYYYRARWYDPDVGRFLAKDPIGFRGGQVDLYGYCLNDPLNLIDPEGDDVGLHFGTQKSLADEVNRSNLPDWAKHKLEGPAEKVDACIHHNIPSRIKGDLLITGDVDVEKDPLRVTGGSITVKFSW
jgi:RHS repeat-associated protein